MPFSDYKTALVTGASSGIGAAVVERLCREGLEVHALARSAAPLATLAERTGCIPHTIDVSDTAALARLTGEVAFDVLVNNAGVDKPRGILKAETADIDLLVDVNLRAVLHLCRLVVPGMVARDSGHVINIGSVAGYWIYPKGNVYNATKFAVRALTEAMSVDLFGTRVRVSSVDPGAAETEFSQVRLHGDVERAKKLYEGYQPLLAEDVADAVVYVANTPPHVMITRLVITPTAQRSPTLIDRKS